MKWQIDPTHSLVGFSVKHMMITTVRGQFNSYKSDFEIDENDFTKSTIELTIDAASINTGNEQRDGHLKSDDFFSIAKFPNITFKSTSIVKVSDEEYTLTGNLTIRDVTKPVTLATEFGGKIEDPYGNYRLGYSLKGSISRKDFGLTFNSALAAGGAVVSDKVNFDIEAEVVRPIAAPAAAS